MSVPSASQVSTDGCPMSTVTLLGLLWISGITTSNNEDTLTN